jgi:hypothetical protein
MPDVKPIPHELTLNGSDADSHNIKEFLARPTVIRTGTWASTSVANTELDLFSIPSDLMALSVFKEKLRGFLGFRATVVLRLQVNCNRFQQGKLILTWYPGGQNTVKHNIVDLSLIFRTQLPHIDFDANTDTEVSLSIPYVSDRVMYDFSTDSGFVGHVGLVVYSPLVAASGELDAEWCMWGHFEDVELLYATTPQGFIAQSGFVSRRRKVDTSTQETKLAGTGPISGFMRRVSAASSILSEIPLLSPIASTASWASSVVARAAGAMGWSKPIAYTKKSFTRKAMMNLANSTGADASHNLGVLEDNAIENIGPFVGTDVDEMNINYILSIPTYYSSTSWTDAQIVGTTLMALSLKPTTFQTVVGLYYYPLPVFYLSQIFHYYRGSFRFTLKVVKTEFHSGRIVLAYFPGATSATGCTLASSIYTHREILDLRESNEITISCPWASSSPYKPVGEPYGMLMVFVLNQLRHPETVAGTVSILTEQSCSSDFEFASPQAPLVAPGCDSTLIGNGEANPDYAWEAQSGMVRRSATAVHDDYAIGSAKVLKDNDSSARSAMGERITNLRQILRRPSLLAASDPASTTWDTITVRPFLVTIPASTSVASDRNYPDWMSYIMPLFAFYRGSIRIKVNGNVPYPITATTFPKWQATNSAQQLPVKFVAATSFRPLVPHAVATTNENFLEVQVPYYSNRHCTRTNLLTRPGVVSVNTVDMQAPTHVVEFRLNRNDANVAFNPATTTMRYNVFRSVGDDFTAGFFTGTVPLINTNSVLPVGLELWD